MNRLRRSDRFRRWPAILGTVLLAAGMTMASVASVAPVSLAAPLSARLPEGHVVEYRVTRDGAPIGSYTVTVHTEGDRVTVSSAVRIEVAFGFITLYRYALDAREVWRAGRLVSFDSTTDDDGERHAVRAVAEAGVIEITADGERWTAPPSVAPSSLWHRDLVDNATLLGVEDGDRLEVVVHWAGPEIVSVAGRPVRATRYIVSGDVERELWYGTDGVLVRLRLIARDDSEILYQIP